MHHCKERSISLARVKCTCVYVTSYGHWTETRPYCRQRARPMAVMAALSLLSKMWSWAPLWWGRSLTPRLVTDFLSVAKWFLVGLHTVSYCKYTVWNDVYKSLYTASVFCLIFSVRRKSVVTNRPPPPADGNPRAHWIRYLEGSRARLDMEVKKEICASSGILPRFAACPARSPVTVLSDSDSVWWRVAF